MERVERFYEDGGGKPIGLVDRNPFVEFVDEAEDFVQGFKLIAEKVIEDIEAVQCDDKAILLSTLQRAKDLLRDTKRVEEFDFITDDPYPVRGGDLLWRSIVHSVIRLNTSVEQMLDSWTESDFPDEFVAYVRSLPATLTTELANREKTFRQSHVWIFMNFFKPWCPFFFRQESGSYIVQSYTKMKQGFDMRSVSMYFMVRLYAH